MGPGKLRHGCLLFQVTINIIIKFICREGYLRTTCAEYKLDNVED